MTSQEIETEVQAQFARFEAELEKLMTGHEGEWVVYLDGVQGFYSTEDEAYRDALKKYGLDRGPLVARIERVAPVLLHAAFAFKLGHEIG